MRRATLRGFFVKLINMTNVTSKRDISRIILHVDTLTDQSIKKYNQITIFYRK